MHYTQEELTSETPARGILWQSLCEVRRIYPSDSETNKVLECYLQKQAKIPSHIDPEIHYFKVSSILYNIFAEGAPSTVDELKEKIEKTERMFS